MNEESLVKGRAKKGTRVRKRMAQCEEGEIGHYV